MQRKHMISAIFRSLTSPSLLAARYAIKKAPPIILTSKPKKNKADATTDKQKDSTTTTTTTTAASSMVAAASTTTAAAATVNTTAPPPPASTPPPQSADPFEEDELKERTTQAEQANPTLERKQQTFSYAKLGWRILIWTSLGLLGYNWYLNNYTQGPESQFGHVKAFSDAANTVYKFFTKPPIDKLLPDIPPLPFGYEIPKTLVLNLTGTMLHTDFVFGKGAEVLKRPGLQKFLRKLSQQFEVVVLTDDDTMFTQGICEKLDPQHNIFAGRFGRESLVIEGNKYVKDLKYLNRPLNRIIVIDDKPERLKKYPDNSIFVDTFQGQAEDNTLNELLPLLDYLSKPDIKDVRSELKKFGNVNPQQRFMEELKAREQKMQQTMKTGMIGMFGKMAEQKGSNQFRYQDKRM